VVYGVAVALVSFVLLLVWAVTTPGEVFWPVYPALALALPLGVGGLVVAAGRHPGLSRRRGLVIHAGVWAALWLYLLAIWVASTPGGTSGRPGC
jgi:hypothetical protein